MKTGAEDAHIPVWPRNEDVGIPIVKCSQREVRVSCLRLCRSIAIDGEKETRHNLKHATRDERQRDRAPGAVLRSTARVDGYVGSIPNTLWGWGKMNVSPLVSRFMAGVDDSVWLGLE
jgi:hypothetical protein